MLFLKPTAQCLKPLQHPPHSHYLPPPGEYPNTPNNPSKLPSPPTVRIAKFSNTAEVICVDLSQIILFDRQIYT